MSAVDNRSLAELSQFNAQASRWWDADGPMRALHDINPARIAYVEQQVGSFAGKRVVDIGCGAGLLSEAMARAGAQVTALDLAADVIEVARAHALSSQLTIDYQLASVETLSARQPASADIVTCMEMLEHVPEPESIVAAAAALLRPGGVLVLSTINRTWRAMALAIVGAEYLTKLVPRGTHRYEQFLKPSELARALRSNDLRLREVRGLHYNPLTRRASMTDDARVNFFMVADKPV